MRLITRNVLNGLVRETAADAAVPLFSTTESHPAVQHYTSHGGLRHMVQVEVLHPPTLISVNYL